MPEETTFAEMIARVRAGDETAAENLVRRYADAIRREVRLRLRDVRVRRLLDSSDICQMVLGSFFTRTALGQFDIHTPNQLLNLLMEIARNKITDAIRHGHTLKHGGAHDFEPIEGANGEVRAVPDSGPTPSEVVANRDLLHYLMSRMSPDERRICQLRLTGRTWEEIAHELGDGQHAIEKRYQRAINRLANEAKLDSLELE